MKSEIKTNTKFSFIIPAFNAESTIERAITSISSRMDDYEIIVVENGSVDRTTETVERIARQNKQVRVTHSEKGVSRARNRGLKEASGEWLIFVDADDEWIADRESLNQLADKLQSSDLIVCSYQKDNRHALHSYKQMNRVLHDREKKDALEWMLTRPTLRMTVWAKLFKRETVVAQGIVFDESLRLSEDADFLISFIKSSRSIAISDIEIYRYCTDTSSVVRSHDKTRIDGYLTALDAIADRVPEGLQGFTDFVIAHLNLICVHNIFTTGNKMNGSERKEELDRVLNNQTIKSAVSMMGIKDIVDLNRIPAVLFKRKMYRAGGIVCYTKALMNKRNEVQSSKKRNQS